MDTKDTILWEGKAEVPPNFWGLNWEGGRLGFSMIDGFGKTETVGPLATILWSGILMLIIYACVYSFGPIWRNLSLIAYFSWLINRYIIREIKYYQLSKNTLYQITNDAINIHQRFLGFNKSIRIPIQDIDTLHLVRYDTDNGVKGSIWIYEKNDIKSIDIQKRERTKIPKMHMISNYKDAFKILQTLKAKQLKH